MSSCFLDVFIWIFILFHLAYNPGTIYSWQNYFVLQVIICFVSFHLLFTWIKAENLFSVICYFAFIDIKVYFRQLLCVVPACSATFEFSLTFSHSKNFACCLGNLQIALHLLKSTLFSQTTCMPYLPEICLDAIIHMSRLNLVNYFASVRYSNSCCTAGVSEKELLQREPWKHVEGILSFLKNRAA